MTLDGKPISPADYEKKLAGATVLVCTTLTCDYFVSKEYQFYTDIKSITVLQPLRAIMAALQSKSPSKKRHFQLPSSVHNTVSKNRNQSQIFLFLSFAYIFLLYGLMYVNYWTWKCMYFLYFNILL